MLTALFWVLLSGPAAQAATPAFVQTASNEVCSGTTNSVAFGSANGAGNLIVAYVVWNNTGAVSMSDSRGNAYASAGRAQTWGGSLEFAGVLCEERCRRRQHGDGDVRATRSTAGLWSTSTSTRAWTRSARSMCQASRPGRLAGMNSVGADDERE